MKAQITQLITTALNELITQNYLPNDIKPTIVIERTRDPAHGDYACNIALILAKNIQAKPRELAEHIKAHVPSSKQVANVEVAGPGFINFFLTETSFQQVISDIFSQKNRFGHATIGAERRVNIELVSANPTGPLHVGHGRLAAYGASVANLLEAIGYHVHREYYVNDAGRQMQILATSIWLRYLELLGEQLTLPQSAYKGGYIIDIAKTLKAQVNKAHFHPMHEVLKDITVRDEDDKEIYIDVLTARARALLGEEAFLTIKQLGLDSILSDIQNDLEEFGVTHHNWYPESRLIASGAIGKVIDQLKTHDAVYETDGALWFKATNFGDEKDRVILREDGRPTYFAADIANHLTKFERGFDTVVDVWGADHHGYAVRMKAFFQTIGIDPNLLTILLVQFAILYRGKQKISMSTRGGSFVTLRELREEVGNDVARFFYIMRKREQHLDFDLELAKSRSSDNPVYYIQYAHARICSVMRQLAAKKLEFNQAQGLEQLHLLSSKHEQRLLRQLSRYPEVILNAGMGYEPHMLANYLQELANTFHPYYNAEQFIVENDNLRNARLCLVQAVKQVVANGLSLLGVSAPETM